MPNVNVENMEDNANHVYEEKMGFAHDADGLDLTDDQLDQLPPALPASNTSWAMTMKTKTKSTMKSTKRMT
jgi:hypothetical protein